MVPLPRPRNYNILRYFASAGCGGVTHPLSQRICGDLGVELEAVVSPGYGEDRPGVPHLCALQAQAFPMATAAQYCTHLRLYTITKGKRSLKSINLVANT